MVVISRFWRAAAFLFTALALLGVCAFVPATAAAAQAGTVTLNGYGYPAHQVFTNSNTYQLFGALGWSNNQRQLYVSIYPADFPDTQRTDIYFVFPPGDPAPGTYVAPGGWEVMPEPGLIYQDFGHSFQCYGGTFTLNSIDTSSPWGEAFDVSWTSSSSATVCGSGHAVFTAVVPPDTTAPTVVFSPSDTVVAVTTEAGTTVDFASHVSATDDRDPNPQITCNPTSGTYFTVGYHEVSCTATDNAGNRSTPQLLRVLVLEPDTTPPYFYYMPDYNVPATDPTGAVVSLYVLAYDERSTATVTCTIEPGGIPVGQYDSYKFPINAPGTNTKVVCVATDASGNQATGSFTVHVQGAWEQTGALIAEIDSWAIPKLGTSLHDKLIVVQKLLASGKIRKRAKRSRRSSTRLTR